MGDPDDLCLEVLPSYRRAVDEAEDGNLLRSARSALVAYEDAEWNGEVFEVAEEFMEGYGDAIAALSDPMCLLNDVFIACDGAIEVERSVWLPDRASVTQVCLDTIAATKGPAALAETLLYECERAFAYSSDPDFEHGVLCGLLADGLNDDAGALAHALLRAVKAIDSDRRASNVLFSALKELVKSHPRETARRLVDAYSQLEVDELCAQDRAASLLHDTKLAIRTADSPSVATVRMLRKLGEAMPGGPPPPDWMVPVLETS